MPLPAQGHHITPPGEYSGQTDSPPLSGRVVPLGRVSRVRLGELARIKW